MSGLYGMRSAVATQFDCGGVPLGGHGAQVRVEDIDDRAVRDARPLDRIVALSGCAVSATARSSRPVQICATAWVSTVLSGRAEIIDRRRAGACVSGASRVVPYP